jgi:6-phosphofructokinase 1
MKAFLSHSSEDAEFVIEVAKYLRRHLDGVFYFQDFQRGSHPWQETVGRALRESDLMILFLGKRESQHVAEEVHEFLELVQTRNEGSKNRLLQVVRLPGTHDGELPSGLFQIRGYPTLEVSGWGPDIALDVARQIILKLGLQWYSDDGLPTNPHLFDYEKDIIKYFVDKAALDRRLREKLAELGELSSDSEEYSATKNDFDKLQQDYEFIRERQLDGCPATWPEIVRWDDTTTANIIPQDQIGRFRPADARVSAVALSSYLDDCFSTEQGPLGFPEAGPRERLAYPLPERDLNVAILVSGGIAPGINAVIDGISQRHILYAREHHYDVHIYGFMNGFLAFERLNLSYRTLGGTETVSREQLDTSTHVSEGGSILGTSRYEDLMIQESKGRRLDRIVRQLLDWRTDILYVIGGDGSMRAAHALWSHSQKVAKERQDQKHLSVVGIPKTMDNDILWVWQTFGFFSAVERAREVIDNLSVEVRSNPRLGVVQLFGSDSGFVVSHAVLASDTGVCDAALIPEVEFSMKALSIDLKSRMHKRAQEQRAPIPYGLVVMAETAIPTDAMDFIDDPDVGLSDNEKRAVMEFNELRKHKERIRGQTQDELRTAGLKIVSRGLHKLLRQDARRDPGDQPDWRRLRIVTNEPRHLLRAIPPRTIDIIMAQRLGILAVDNALAGYTDFMVSQWLTEYVLVPLSLVALGRKRIPRDGIFWKSVIAKTGQSSDLVNPPITR